MKNLSLNDIVILKQFRYLDEDIEQIDKAIINIRFFLCNTTPVTVITADKAKKLLGSETFIVAVLKSVFHLCKYEVFIKYCNLPRDYILCSRECVFINIKYQKNFMFINKFKENKL